MFGVSFARAVRFFRLVMAGVEEVARFMGLVVYGVECHGIGCECVTNVGISLMFIGFFR